MLFAAEMEKFIWEGIIFLAFILICGRLVEPRFNKKAALLLSCGVLAGIILLQAGLLLSGQDATLVLTMLPLTAYLPAIICLHIISRAGFFQTMAIWTVGAIVYFILKTLWKILLWCFAQQASLPGWGSDLLMTLILLLISGLLVFLVFRFLPQPFKNYILKNQTNWLLLSFPVLMIFLMFSYFSSSTTNITLLILLLLTALSVFLVLIKVLTSAAAIKRLQASEKNIARQMQMQRREYEELCQKMELGRTYRHDMRHHLLVLDGLAQQGDTQSITSYIRRLNSQLSDTEKETYCENRTINAVLTSCFGKAKEAQCSVTAQVLLPNDIPFAEMDVCIVLANALENALNACREIPAAVDRYIHLTAELIDQRKLIITVANPCNRQLTFDADGFPIVPEQEGHGIGLRSISAIVQKYHGLFHCECQAGEFHLHAVLFDQPEAKVAAKKSSLTAKIASSAGICLLAFAVLINCAPTLAQALSEVPGLGTLVRLADLRSYNFSWGDTSFNAVLPVLEANAPSSSNDPSGAPLEETATKPDEANPPDGEAADKDGDSSATDLPSTNNTTSNSSINIDLPILEWLLAAAAQSPAQEPTNETDSPGTIVPPETSNEEEAEPEAEEEPDASTDPDSEEEENTTPNISAGIDDMNQQMEAYIEQMEDKFWWYVGRKYQGYVGMDSAYQILRNDELMLSIRFETTINAGGSGLYSRCITLDKQNGRVLELADLFQQDSDYISIISGEILKQMTQQVASGQADYFIPGGIWSDDECFKSISSEQNFYINSQNQLVIVFDEYEVAPGSMGMPEFIIPTAILQGILQQPSLIS